MRPTVETLIKQAYTAFNNRDIDAVLMLMTPDVHWPNGWEGGYVEGHDDVRAYWTRQWKELDPYVQPISIHQREDEKIVVNVRQQVKDKHGKPLFNGMVKHIYTIESGLIKSMEIEY
ncbi:nuclear transport factor 2 family protein [Ilyomonas limi]|uniref:Nuclear transport factor 2 family protein n=1 Tax=Ilyomonas limi TaxID=2575867 RepID=A0A4U3L9C7_9BACT|nr:nuclear transport factor 2 family protein [Ilyomonas limi]TKK71700.1 nuclear transport factor 2 family protein [Ilyomonas limi]